ncbi:Tektin-2 [Eumeta japonica]|uniref:Tektin n=1 Tax=Eumeta variegata TaxID=151549 RepID=A0A4C1TGK1_EUMVA|nr:Tektin-2 [Eumeta japonica]
MVSKIGSEDMAVAVPEMLRKIDKINNMVVDKINKTQELCLLVALDQESSEYLIKKSLENRISSIAAWRWVLMDLSQRLNNAVDVIQHEKDAVLAVIERLKGEIHYRVEKCSRPGILAPRSDPVEEAIIKEYRYLRKQKVMFTKEALNLDSLLFVINDTKNKIDVDLRGKETTIAVEEACINSNQEYIECNRKPVTSKNRKKKITSWEKRCDLLKSNGLYALKMALEERARIRAARVQLSCGAGARAARVDAALRRRLRSNEVVIEELQWQTEEALNDLYKLDAERETTENTILQLLDKARATEARLAERSRRPPAELLDDDVDKLLKKERAQIKRNIKKFQENLNNIVSLQSNLTKAIAELDDRVADVKQVLQIDVARMNDRRQSDREREEHVNPDTENSSCFDCETYVQTATQNSNYDPPSRLDQIPEEDEDDYPFDY